MSLSVKHSEGPSSAVLDVSCGCRVSRVQLKPSGQRDSHWSTMHEALQEVKPIPNVWTNVVKSTGTLVPSRYLNFNP